MVNKGVEKYQSCPSCACQIQTQPTIDDSWRQGNCYMCGCVFVVNLKETFIKKEGKKRTEAKNKAKKASRWGRDTTGGR